MVKTDYFQKRFMQGCLTIMAMALFFLKVPFVLKNPFFTGDSGIRMHYAYQIIIGAVNRFWLPFLQLHIWIFYKLRLPYYVYKFIPCFYFFLAVLFLGKLAYRHIGRDYPGLLFSSLLLFCFAYHGAVMFLSVNLYQEMLEMALFYILLYMGVLDLRKHIFLLVIGSIALLTRDTFWIYLFVLSLLDRRRILSDKTYFFAFIWLWAIPLVWIASVPFAYLTKFGRWPQWPIEWPLMINRQSSFAISYLFNSLKSLGAAIAVNKLVFLIAALVIAWALNVLYPKSKKKEIIQHDAFDTKFKVFSLTSLTIIYSLVFLFNPWEWTRGNMRMGVPLLYHLFIWALLFYKETFDYPKAQKIIVRTVLILGLLSMVNKNTSSWFARDYSNEIRAYSGIRSFINNTYKNCQPSICVIENSYWEFTSRFIAPTLYMKPGFVKVNKNHLAKDYDVVIAPSNFDFKDKRFLGHAGAKFRLRGRLYTIYSKR